MIMKNPPHPGKLVRHDCLEPLGLSVTDGASALGKSRKALSDLVNGKAGVSPEMAVRLSKAFGGSVGIWLRMQAAYDEAQVMKRASRIKVKRVPQPEAA
jgi:addiction module HigA family antidote